VFSKSFSGRGLSDHVHSIAVSLFSPLLSVSNGNNTYAKLYNDPNSSMGIASFTINKLGIRMIFSAFAAIFIVRAIAIVIYRLFFHPLAEFPGPKYLGISRLFEFYYDVIKTNQFPNVITDLHEKYGPIVRISPNEVSINDKLFQNEFFHNDQNLWKDPRFYFFGFRDGLFVTLDKKKHIVRKRHFVSLMQLSGSYFANFHPLIAEKINDTLRTIENASSTKNQLNLSVMFRKMSSDIALELSLGSMQFQSRDYKDGEEFRLYPVFRYMASLRQSKVLCLLYKYSPTWVFTKYAPGMEYVRECEAGLRPLLQEYAKMDSDTKASLFHSKPKPFIHSLLDSSNLYAESDYQTSIEEFVELLWASREGIGHALTTVSYFLMINPQSMKKLHEELRDSADFDLDTASYAQLRRLPYLDSVCKECLRLLAGNKLRQPRISSGSVRYGRWTIPAGYTISASQDFLHRNAEIFPEPDSFRPERWLETVDTKEMDKYWNPFGYGSRACGGKALTYEVIWRTVANVFARVAFNFELDEAQRAKEGGALGVFPSNSTPSILATVSKYDE
jgi:cytochrome P450